MPQNGKPDINETLREWADICIKIWREKMIQMKVYNTGELYKSLKRELYRQSGGDINKIEFIFYLYGIYVDAGAGRGDVGGGSTWLTNESDDWNKRTDRVRKQWFSSVFWAQLHRLREIMVQKYGEQVTWNVTETMKGASVDIDPFA